MKDYRMCFTVPEDRVTLIMNLLSGEVKAFSVTEVLPKSAEAAPPVKPATRRKATTHSLIADTRSGQAVLDVMAHLLETGTIAQVSAHQVGELIEVDGFAHNTASSVLCGLVREGRVVRHGHGRDYRYSLPAPKLDVAA